MAKQKNENQPEQSEPRRGRGLSTGPQGGGISPLARLRSEFDRVFDDFFRGWGGVPALQQESHAGWGLDIEDQEDKIVVRAEAPGFEPDDFDLQVHDNQLVLCACQSEESSEEGSRHWHRQELYRSIPLPSGIDEEHVDAKYRNGILTVTLPKTEQGKGRRIEVKI